LKVILDCKPENMGTALNAFFSGVRDNPEQEVGRENAIGVRLNGVDFLLIKNLDSYTVLEFRPSVSEGAVPTPPVDGAPV